MAQPSTHLDRLSNQARTPDGCVECSKIGDNWLRLRRCLVCGNVGCCDNSRNRHATWHFRETGHLFIETLESADGRRFIDEAHIAEGREFANRRLDEGQASSRQRDRPSKSTVRDQVALLSRAAPFSD